LVSSAGVGSFGAGRFSSAAEVPRSAAMETIARGLEMTFENRGACVHRKQTVGCKETSKNKPQDNILKASTQDVIKSDETLDLEAPTQS
jgi:hypothetical protein